MYTDEMFRDRLIELRTEKGVSAREMSISLGQGVGYISNIENGKNMPSWGSFFYICDYFKISPKDFFDVDSTSPAELNVLIEKMKNLGPQKLKLIGNIIDEMK